MTALREAEGAPIAAEAMPIDLSGTKKSILQLECGQCKTPLIRVTGAHDEDWVVCNICGRGGNYKEVVEKGQELEPNVLTSKDISDLMTEFGLYGEKRFKS